MSSSKGKPGARGNKAEGEGRAKDKEAFKMGKKDVHAIVSGAGWIGSFAGLLVDDLEELEVPFEDIHKLGKPTKEGRPLVRTCAEMIAQAVRGKQSDYLKLISGSESLVLNPADGSEILANADDAFAYIDSDFRSWDADEPGAATEATPVHVYEQVQDATFSQMFGSLSADVRKVCFTQTQIKGFVRKYPQWLRSGGYATFFLFQSRGHFFVARVNVYSGGRLEVYVYQFEYSGVWSAGDRSRLVVPQLAV